MIKYQEALNRVNKAIAISLVCLGIDLKEDNETELALKTLQELINEHEKLKEEYQKLKDKETPKKPIRHLNSLYRCKNCDELFQNWHNQNHCPNCGQKLDWSDTNENI